MKDLNEMQKTLVKKLGEEALETRANSRSAYFGNRSTGKLWHSAAVWGKFHLSGLIKHYDSVEELGNGALQFSRKLTTSFSKLNLIEGEGRRNTLEVSRTQTISYADGEITSVVADEATELIALNYLDQPVNELFLKSLKAAHGDLSIEELAAIVSRSTYVYEFDPKELDVEDFKAEVNVKPYDGGGVLVSFELKKNGKEITDPKELPVGYTVEIEPNEGILGLKNSTRIAGEYIELGPGKYHEFIIDTDLNNPNAYHILNSNGVNIEVRPKWKESDSDVLRGLTRVSVPELSEMLETYDYAGLLKEEELSEDYIIPNFMNFIHVQIADISNLKLPLFVYMNGKHVDYNTIKSKADVEFSIASKVIEETQHDLNGLRIIDILNSPNGCVGVFPLTCKIIFEGEVFERTINTNIAKSGNEYMACSYGLGLADLPSNEEQYYYLQKG